MDAETIAKYYLSKDPERILFNNHVVVKNHRKFYEGNARLNKYLFLTQVIYLAKYEKKLIKDDFVAYENGPIIDCIRKGFPIMFFRNEKVSIPSNIKTFLDKIYDSLINASYEELIEITHEDPEWIELSKKHYYIMDLKKHTVEYKHRYRGLIEAMQI